MLEKIEKPVIETVKLKPDGTYGMFTLEPLECGYGNTLGNSLRRVLLSSLPGVAVTSVKIDGVQHEFSTIPGVKEDVTEIILNIKGLIAKMYGECPKTVYIEAEGECDVTAGDIKTDSEIEILDPGMHIATLGPGAKLYMEITLDKGRGYVSAEKNKQQLQPVIGIIAVDSIYTPVLKVNYTVENTRVGQRTDYDKLILEVWTDGTISLINRFGWQDNSSIIEGDKTSNRAFSNDLYLQLTQPIFTYNKRKMELKQIEYDYENANISYALQRLSTEKDITQQFYSVYMAQSQLAITKEELTNAQQSYEIIKNKVEADLAARDELFQAEVNLASARSSLEEQQVSLENSKDQLKQTLGMDLNEDIMVFAEVQIKPVEVNLEKAIQHGLESRLELRQREIESKELAFDMIKTKALNEFKGDIALSFGLIGDNRHLEKIYNNPTQNPRVAISFSVPIFDWGEKKARVKAQEVAQKINRLEFHEDKVNIELNIRQTWRSLENLL